MRVTEELEIRSAVACGRIIRSVRDEVVSEIYVDFQEVLFQCWILWIKRINSSKTFSHCQATAFLLPRAIFFSLNIRSNDLDVACMFAEAMLSCRSLSSAVGVSP